MSKKHKCISSIYLLRLQRQLKQSEDWKEKTPSLQSSLTKKRLEFQPGLKLAILDSCRKLEKAASENPVRLMIVVMRANQITLWQCVVTSQQIILRMPT